MTTALAIDESEVSGLVPVIPEGILSHVVRVCDEHGASCPCVGQSDGTTGLVFWCPEGEHLLTFR